MWPATMAAWPIALRTGVRNLSSSFPIQGQQPPIPEPVARIAALMSTFAPTWFLCGGWAVDAWLGRQSRDHDDLDITIFHEDQQALFQQLAGFQLVADETSAAGDTSERWEGRRLTLPAHIHARADDGVNIEVILNQRSGGDWVLSREAGVALPLTECVRQSAWGLPTAVPKVLVLYKANLLPTWANSQPKARRPHDESDFLALLPHLSNEDRIWLREVIARSDPGHPWVPLLAAAAS